MNLEFHPIAQIFPLLEGRAFDDLVDDIKANGQHVPIVLYEGMILDGRNRYRACQRLGIKAEGENYTGDNPLGYVISLNLHRRHLNESQRAMIAARLVNTKLGDNQYKRGSANLQTLNDSQIQLSQSEVSRMLNVSPRSVATAKQIIETAPPETIKAVEDGRVKLYKANRELEIEVQKEDIKSNSFQAPAGLFDVIVLDPPWPYGTKYDPDGRRAANPYPEMSLEEISNINLPASGDCILWLWTTHKFMRYSFDLLDKWQFRDVAILTWVKDRMGLGSWLRSQSEFCIMAVKGNPKVNLTNQTTVIHGALREHSRKPDEFYSMVDGLCNGYKIDWFSREIREGWAQFGNDTTKF